jgi:hypothetical protein
VSSAQCQCLLRSCEHRRAERRRLIACAEPRIPRKPEVLEARAKAERRERDRAAAAAKAAEQAEREERKAMDAATAASLASSGTLHVSLPVLSDIHSFCALAEREQQLRKAAAVAPAEPLPAAAPPLMPLVRLAPMTPLGTPCHFGILLPPSFTGHLVYCRSRERAPGERRSWLRQWQERQCVCLDCQLWACSQAAFRSVAESARSRSVHRCLAAARALPDPAPLAAAAARHVRRRPGTTTRSAACASRARVRVSVSAATRTATATVARTTRWMRAPSGAIAPTARLTRRGPWLAIPARCTAELVLASAASAALDSASELSAASGPCVANLKRAARRGTDVMLEMELCWTEIR